MKCEDCRGVEWTTPSMVAEENKDAMNFFCEECNAYVTLEYCRGHDMFYEMSCPNCDELNGE